MEAKEKEDTMREIMPSFSGSNQILSNNFYHQFGVLLENFFKNYKYTKYIYFLKFKKSFEKYLTE